ncbi:MAG: nuclear transport factor 2 family protein [Chroococcidiopsidaceae cyanobacterium CP_BM_ER_R8_30]|nr:nuclear transport factor 2 family protein [Chroococcidiopsidaceae cyanobacterium CP_BM_ER_R8_30]
MSSELSAIQWMIQRCKIIDIVVGIANAMDDKNWQKLRKYLADEVYIDYLEFRDELPQQITAEAYVQQRIDGLIGLKTLHISTNHEVSIIKDRAQCRSAFSSIEYNLSYTSQ